MHNKNKWFIIPKPKPNADLKLICFPYAGGGGSVFTSWSKYLPDNIELVIVQAPGKGSHIADTPYDSMEVLIHNLLKEVLVHFKKPYILFGHSLGSRIAFELMNEAYRLYNTLPLHFIASGSSSPHKKLRNKPIYNLPTEDFIQELKKLNGTPKEVLENRELMDCLLPVIRADFKISDEYLYQGRADFRCPVSVLTGENDLGIPLESAKSWGDFFTQEINVHIIPGDHFFINSHREIVLEKINSIILKSPLFQPINQDATFCDKESCGSSN
jgi:surfactin synthase thioesterase subunit